jgi:hypothetical protein
MESALHAGCPWPLRPRDSEPPKRRPFAIRRARARLRSPRIQPAWCILSFVQSLILGLLSRQAALCVQSNLVVGFGLQEFCQQRAYPVIYGIRPCQDHHGTAPNPHIRIVECHFDQGRHRVEAKVRAFLAMIAAQCMGRPPANIRVLVAETSEHQQICQHPEGAQCVPRPESDHVSPELAAGGGTMSVKISQLRND